MNPHTALVVQWIEKKATREELILVSQALAKKGAFLSDYIPLTLEQRAKVEEYLKVGQKLNAVKEIKEWTGMGLKECKDLVDNMSVWYAKTQ